VTNAYAFALREMHADDQAADASGCADCGRPVTHMKSWKIPDGTFTPHEQAVCTEHAEAFAAEHRVEIEPATAAPWAVEQQAIANLRKLLAEGIDRYSSYVSAYLAAKTITRRPEFDKDTTHLAFEVESKPGNRFTVLMPTLPLDLLRAGRPSFSLPPAERRAHEIRIRHAPSSPANPDYWSADYWDDALRRCGRVADFRTPEQALALLFSRM
jgi:hypothetical protein